MLSNDPMIQFLVTMVRARADRLRQAKDRGSMSIEAAILVAVLVALAIGLGVFLNSKMTQKEGQIN